MVYVTREDSIDILRLSIRTSNCLRREGIHTVGQVLDTPSEVWPNIRSMGVKSVAELENVVAQLKTGGRLTLVESKPQPSASQSGPPRLPSIPIQKLGLSIRAVNCLTSAGIATADDLSGVTRDYLMSIKNMGTKTAQEILDRLELLWKGLDPTLVHELAVLRERLESNPASESDLRELLAKAVKAVSIGGNDYIELELINGKIIEKERSI